MNYEEIPENYQFNQQIYSIVSYLLVSMMMVCVSVTVMLFLEKLLLGWHAPYLPAICFLISLERIYSYKFTKRYVLFSQPWIISIISQWVVILLLIRLVVLVSKGIGSFWLELQLLVLDFQSSFLEIDFVIALGFALITWLISGFFAELLDEMSLEESLLKFETAVFASRDEPPPRERLLVTIFNIGIFLIILTAIMRVDLMHVMDGRLKNIEIMPLPYLAAGAWNVLLYFLLGLILISQSQFARLNARWTYRKIPVVREMGARWVGYSIVFIVFLAFLASLLPTNYSLDFLSVIRYILQFIFELTFFILGLLGSIFSYLVNLLSRPVEEVSPVFEDSQLLDFEPPPLPDSGSISNVYPWMDVLKSLVFWLVFIGVVGFSMYQFSRQHKGAWEFMRRIPGFKWMANFFRWLVDGFRGLNQRIAAVVDSGIHRLSERRRRSVTGQGRFINLRRLSPRQRIFYFFLAMIRRGGDHGLPRRGDQTPYEYSAVLENAVPDVDEDVASLTDAFVEARYSRSVVDESQVGIVKRYWQRIRSALRSIRQ